MEAKQFPTLQQSNKCETHLCSVTDSFIVCLGIKWIFERFELFTPLKIQVVVFWVLTPSNDVASQPVRPLIELSALFVS
jgi:hypothetical protein